MLTRMARVFNTNGTIKDVSDAEAALPFVPEEVLNSMLQHVPLQQRLASCALVCHAWTAAAAQTTADISVSIPQDLSTDSCQHLTGWLQRNGCRVASIRLQNCPARGGTQASQSVTLQLPTAKLTQLQTLDLQGIQVALQRQQSRTSTRSSTNRKRARSDSSNDADNRGIPAAPAAHLLPQLRSLRLHSCKIPINSFVQLSQLSSLTALSVIKPVVTTSQDFINTTTADRTETALSKVLQQLTSLEQLELAGFNEANSGVLSHELLSPISTMQRLQSLSVELGPYWPHSLAFLPTSLTALQLKGDVTLSPSTPPQLSQISGLQSLELLPSTDPGNDYGTNLDPAALYSCPNLTRLCLDGIGITPAAGDVSLRGGRVLEPLSYLTQLRHLRFSQSPELEPAAESVNIDLDSDLYTDGDEDSDSGSEGSEDVDGNEGSDLDSEDGSDWEEDADPGLAQADAVRYCIHPGCFAASSQLTALEFNDGLPRSRLHQLFGENQRLPQLAVLKLYFMDEEADMDEYGWPAALPWAFSRIPLCCPALRELQLWNILCTGSHLSSFTQLRGSLTTLILASDDGAAREVAKLTALRSLVWCVQPLTSYFVGFKTLGMSRLSNAGLLQLTALRKLTDLTLEGWDQRAGSLVRTDNPDCDVATLRSSQEAARPDVWRQLKQLVPRPHPSNQHQEGRQNCVVS